jgi:multidrug resistance efflux pump
MEILLVLIYVAICIAIFKIFRIPVNQWSLSTAALGGIVGISLLLLTMNYNPFTKNTRIYFPLTPILPNVKGRVVEVPVHGNTPLKEGDILFRMDPKPYEYVVAQKKAALAEAEQNVKQLKASLDQVTAEAEKADAQMQLAQQNYDRQAQLFKANVVAQATLDTATRNLDASKQTVAAAKAEEERARLAYTSNIDGVNTSVAKLQAELPRACDVELAIRNSPKLIHLGRIKKCLLWVKSGHVQCKMSCPLSGH